MEWTDWHEFHKGKIEFVPGVDCWIWTAGRTSDKTHGRVRFTDQNGQRYSEYAHRASYISAYGKIKDGAFICHKCGVGLCVRPSHLYEGSAKTNGKDTADMRAGTALLSYQQAYEVRVMYNQGVPISEISNHFNIAFGTVYPIVMGKSYKHAPFPDGHKAAQRVRPPLSREEVIGIKKLLRQGMTHRLISEKYDISGTTISKIRTGKRYANIT